MFTNTNLENKESWLNPLSIEKKKGLSNYPAESYPIIRFIFEDLQESMVIIYVPTIYPYFECKKTSKNLSHKKYLRVNFFVAM